MSGYANFRGHAKPKPYVAPRPKFTDEQRLEECLRIADRIEHGQSSPVDEIALQAHLKVLTGRPVMDYEENAMAGRGR